MKDSLRKWYKNGFDRLKVIPPASAWKKISSQLKAFPAVWYQLNAEKLDVKPAAGSWDAISANLQPYNKQKKEFRQFLYRGVAAIAIFAIVPFAFNDAASVETSSSREIQESNGTNQVLLAEWLSTDSESISTPLNEEQSGIQESNAQNDSEVLNGNQTPLVLPVQTPVLVAVHEPAQNGTPTTAESEQNQSNVDALMLLALMPVSGDVDRNGLNTLSNPEHKTIAAKKWGIGPKINFHGSSFLTPQTNLALSSSSMVQNPFGLNISYGATGVYEINHKNRLEADLMFNDVKTQRIQDYSDGSYVEKRTDLVYTSFSLSYKRNILNSHRNVKMPKGLNLVSGIFGSYRMSIMEMLDYEVVSDLRDGYRKFDLGFNTGVDYSVRVSPKLEWVTGLKYQIGLVNIFAGIDKIPASLFKTRTQSLGVATTLLYRF